MRNTEVLVRQNDLVKMIDDLTMEYENLSQKMSDIVERIKEKKCELENERRGKYKKVKYGDRTVYVISEKLNKPHLSILRKENDNWVIVLNSTLTEKEKAQELHIWLTKKKCINWHDENTKKKF